MPIRRSNARPTLALNIFILSLMDWGHAKNVCSHNKGKKKRQGDDEEMRKARRRF